MRTSFYIARRYVNSRSKSSAINIITGITAIGVLVGAMVMFVVLSAFSGLRDYSLSLISNFDPDLKLLPASGKTLIFEKEQQQKIEDLQDVAHYSCFLEERILLRYKSKEQIAYIKGVDENFNLVNQLTPFIYMGEWNLEGNRAVVDYGTAYKLSMGVFDTENTMQMLVPKPGKGSLSLDDFNKVTIFPVGIYSFGDEQNSLNYVFTSLPLAQSLLGQSEQTLSGIEFKLRSGVSDQKVKSELKAIFGEDIVLKNRTELNETLYKMLNTENLIVYLVITLVVIITLFTLIGTIIMVILDKKQNLKTLYSLGMPIGELRRIFLFQGILLSFIGCLTGLILGIIIVVIQQQFGIWMLGEGFPYPVQFTVVNIVIVLGTILTLSFIASKIASSRVSKKIL